MPKPAGADCQAPRGTFPASSVLHGAKTGQSALAWRLECLDQLVQLVSPPAHFSEVLVRFMAHRLDSLLWLGSSSA
jgi:hypothetical protein